MLTRHSVDWAGDMIRSPHGDWVHAGDAMRLEDDLEASQKAKAALMARVAELEEELTTLKADTTVARRSEGGRLFAWINPNDARRFNSGKTAYCKVFKKRTNIFCMPLKNILGPNHYQKPPAGEVVTVLDGERVKVLSHVPEGLAVVSESGEEFIAKKWSWNPNGYSDERGNADA